jgi:hypothetical protein
VDALPIEGMNCGSFGLWRYFGCFGHTFLALLDSSDFAGNRSYGGNDKMLRRLSDLTSS